MIAPRAVIILGNPGYDWLGDESGYKSTMAAVEIFKAMGVAGPHRLRLHRRSQPLRAAGGSSRQRDRRSSNRFLKGTSTTSNVTIKPDSSGKMFNLDLTTAINWTTPTLQ